MRIKTNLSHERKGGHTTVMFGKPTLRQTKLERIIEVEFAVIKIVKRKEDGLLTNRCFQPKLLKSQQKKIWKYAEQLVAERYPEIRGQRCEVILYSNSCRFIWRKN